ncbi:MAG: acyl-CoA dehydrogenase family protein [Rhizobiales bacterium]|nr:acyl-CoA dehydrogenase family protein [Hyphomicrobiales bacterium]
MSEVSFARSTDDASNLMQVAASYMDEIVRRSDEFENLRHMPQDLADRMARDGLYQICTPVEYGGSEHSPRVYAEVVELLAQADASAAWCVFIGITSSFLLASGQTEALKEILRKPGVTTSGVLAPNGRAVRTTRDGVPGYILNGRWQWGSGSRNAEWISSGGMVVDDHGHVILNADDKPEQLSLVVNASDVKLLDTWTVMGLQGTGSTDYQIENVFVPEDRTISRYGVRKNTHPIFLFPNFGMLAIGIASVALGAARAAVDDLVAFASKKVPQGNRRTLAEKPATQKDIAKAEAALRAGRAFFYEAIDAAWAGANQGDISTAHRRDVRLATTHAVASAKQCIDIIYELAGGTAVYRTSPIQRRFRDVQVAGQHMMVSQATYELVGRLMLGLHTNIDEL